MYNECRHILPGGKKCHSPALRNQAFCYYHTHLRRYRHPSPSDNPSLPSIEDHHGIQIALTQVLSVLNSPYVDIRRARLLLSGLHLAAALARQIASLQASEVVRSCEEVDGVALADEKAVCEPPTDCRNCARRLTCENFEEPDENEDDEEQEAEDPLEENNDHSQEGPDTEEHPEEES